jgi:hypothetical protein
LAATALIASPVLGVPQKKSAKSAQSHTQRMAPRTTQMAGAYRRGNSSSYMGTRQYTGTQRYAATRQYSGTHYYGYNGFASNSYYNGSRYYYGGPGYYYGAGLSYPYYGYYSSWPYASYGYYPNSYYGGYSNAYSYYQPGYGYDTATVAAVQRRLGELGYYHGTVDGAIGPQTRGAIAAFESRNGMSVDGMITTRLLNRIGLA